MSDLQMGRAWQDRETLDEMDEYLDGDWSEESLKALDAELDRLLGEKVDEDARADEG